MRLIPTGSQAVSSTNLTNDDTLSIRSMSVDDTPDFDKDYTLTRTKHSVAGLRNEITELRNDITDLKNDIVESKNELNDTTLEKHAKTPVLTPGGRNRVNPFLRDCEEKELMLDPLGAIPVENVMASSQRSVVTNGDVSEASLDQDSSVGELFGKIYVMLGLGVPLVR